jgi:hypothetical protein
MEKEDRETMRHISKTLDAVLAVLVKSQNRVERIVDIVTTGITVLSIISIIEIIRSWIGG